MTKTEITAFDLHFLTQELQNLANERLDKIYVLDDRGVLITFGNKAMLQVEPGKLWTPLQKPATPEQIHPFAAQLRKLIGNSKVERIGQVCSERILSIHVIRSGKKFVLLLEIFGRGNIVLCDETNSVIAALALNERVQRRQAYQLPKGTDAFHIDEKQFAGKLLESQDNISKTLAAAMGLGKTLAEELCVRCGISTAEKPTAEHAHEIHHELHKMLGQKTGAQLVFDGIIIADATPIPFQCYAAKKRENIEGFGAALDRIFSLPAEAVKEQKTAPVQEKLKKIETMIQMQEQSLARLEQKAEEERKKGEYIYEHYQEVSKLLSEIVEAKKKLSWKEVKQKFPQILELNEATGEIIVEV
jgi:predicted ribosome quality control (RQC) complex YloA/Tae2 family protein